MLTQRQAAFVDYQFTCRNGAEAARRAGFAVGSARVTASRLLSKANIRAAIAAKEADLARLHDLSRDRVLQDLLDGIEVARQNRNPQAMIEGAAQVARMLGYFAPAQVAVKRVAGRNEYQNRLAKMSEAELRAMLDP